MRMCLRFVTFVTGWLAASIGGHAACEVTGIQSISPSTIFVGNYTATSIPPPTTVALTLTLTKTGNGNCQAGFSLYRLTLPARMTRLVPPTLVTLPYLANSEGTNLLHSTAGNPAIVRLPNFHPANGPGTGTVTATVTIVPQVPLAAPPAGTYFDVLMLRVYKREGGNSYDYVGQSPLTISTGSLQSCNLSAPGSLSLNFSSDIVTGIPAGAVQSTSFNVNCTGPSRLQLSGSALVMPSTTGASGAFDDLINFRAVANFGGASATLTTNGTTTATITSPSASTVVGSNLPVNLNINLIPNRPLRSSPSYSGVLRVIVDPTL